MSSCGIDAFGHLKVITAGAGGSIAKEWLADISPDFKGEDVALVRFPDICSSTPDPGKGDTMVNVPEAEPMTACDISPR